MSSLPYPDYSIARYLFRRKKGDGERDVPEPDPPRRVMSSLSASAGDKYEEAVKERLLVEGEGSLAGAPLLGDDLPIPNEVVIIHV